MREQTHHGRPFRILNVIGESTREGLATRVARQLTGADVQECLTTLCCPRGIPMHLRSDNGPQFTAKKIRKWLNELGASTLFIEPGSPWENGYVESFNGREYNTLRPHSALGYRAPAPEAIRLTPLAAPLHERIGVN